MAAERKPVPSGIFINDLNAPSVLEKLPTVEKTQAEETEHAEKTEHAPSGPALDQAPRGPTCQATGQPDPS